MLKILYSFLCAGSASRSESERTQTPPSGLKRGVFHQNIPQWNQTSSGFTMATTATSDNFSGFLDKCIDHVGHVYGVDGFVIWTLNCSRPPPLKEHFFPSVVFTCSANSMLNPPPSFGSSSIWNVTQRSTLLLHWFWGQISKTSVSLAFHRYFKRQLLKNSSSTSYSIAQHRVLSHSLPVVCGLWLEQRIFR